jgi:sugar O-acyltransferase (sialic acid O-acetyltransferase NeuD family)
MKKEKDIVIFGDSAFAEIAYEYFEHDSPYRVKAFTINREFMKRDSLFGLPIVAFEDVTKLYPPSSHDMHVALVYNKLNRIRMQFYEEAKGKGYKLANYVSSRAFVWRNVEMGDNCFIFEDNTVQPFVKLGSNIVLWSGNHIGHHTKIGSHCFIASQVVISGFCEIGEACFFGVNSTMGNNLKVGRDSLVGAGALIVKDGPEASLYKGPATFPDAESTHKRFLK